jgi:hypothetical protein
MDSHISNQRDSRCEGIYVDAKAQTTRECDGLPWGFPGEPAPIPAKTRTRSHGCGFPVGTSAGFHETHMSDAPGKEYIKMRFRPIKTQHGSKKKIVA